MLKEKQEILSRINKKDILLEVQREIYRRSFYDFFCDAVKVLEPQTNWDFNFHHKYIADVLQKEALRITNNEKRDKHIIINVPFRSSKTLMVSVCYPVWCAVINNKMSFINLSYSAGLSTDASNKVIELINNPWFKELFPFEFDEHHRAKTDFKLKQGFSRISSGFLGAVLGRGADIIVMDDANSTKELSDVGRKNTIRTFKDTIRTRLNQPDIGLFINIQQRLHYEDLSGYLLKNFPDEWQHVCLPAEVTSNVSPPEMALHYQNGLLWENRFTKEVLDNFKTVLGSTGYANQLLQEATADEGNIIKKQWLSTITLDEFNKLLSDNGIRVSWEMYIDSGYGKSKSDNTGILIGAKILNNVYVKKAYNVNLEFPDLIKKIAELFISHNCRIIRIEPKASGISIVQQLKRQTNLAVAELPHKKDDKETCLNSVSPLIESGRLIMIEDISNDIIINQLTKFPNYGEDEFVDLVYYILSGNIGKGFNYKML